MFLLVFYVIVLRPGFWPQVIHGSFRLFVWNYSSFIQSRVGLYLFPRKFLKYKQTKRIRMLKKYKQLEGKIVETSKYCLILFYMWVVPNSFWIKNFFFLIFNQNCLVSKILQILFLNYWIVVIRTFLKIQNLCSKLFDTFGVKSLDVRLKLSIVFVNSKKTPTCHLFFTTFSSGKILMAILESYLLTSLYFKWYSIQYANCAM